MMTRTQRWTIRAATAIAVLAFIGYSNYSNLVNLAIPAAHRPARITYAVERVSNDEFERLASELQTQRAAYTSIDRAPQNAAVYETVAKQLAGSVRSFGRRARLDHIDRFRKAGIREYRGPETCLQCHGTMQVRDGQGGYVTVDTRRNIEESVHFGLNKFSGFNTYGFNGKKV